MKSKPIIFFGIIVAVIICCTELSGFTGILYRVDKPTGERIRNIEKKQIHMSPFEKRRPSKHICII